MSYTIYQIDAAGWMLAGPLEIGDAEGCPAGWSRLPAADVPEGKFARWQGEWAYLDEGPAAPPAPVPEKISNLQARGCLRMRGIFQAVDDALTAVAAGDPGNGVDPQPAMLDYWNYASEFHRSHFGIAIIAAIMGWTPEFVDDMFREAITYY